MSNPDPHVLDAEHLPTPFSADEIRGATPRGRTLVVRAEPADGPAATHVNRFAEVDADGALQERTPLGPDGEPSAQPTVQRVTWRGLQEHALYPESATVRDRVRIAHPLGALDCMRYTTSRDDTTETFWFDLERPGMPVLVETRRAGELLLRMTVLADEVRPG